MRGLSIDVVEEVPGRPVLRGRGGLRRRADRDHRDGLQGLGQIERGPDGVGVERLAPGSVDVDHVTASPPCHAVHAGAEISVGRHEDDVAGPEGAERGDGIDFGLGTAADPGYFLLAHHPENYLISCKTCNTALKGNGFPVDGSRDNAMTSPRRTTERHFLVYPLGMVDEDPQRLIRFEGVVPVPAARSGHRRRRGQVIINFFQLAERDGLLEERSMTILGLHLALISIDHPDELSRRLARETVDRMTGDASAHANCARSFVSLWSRSRTDAETFSRAAFDHLVSLP